MHFLFSYSKCSITFNCSPELKTRSVLKHLHSFYKYVGKSVPISGFCFHLILNAFIKIKCSEKQGLIKDIKLLLKKVTKKEHDEENEWNFISNSFWEFIRISNFLVFIYHKNVRSTTKSFDNLPKIVYKIAIILKIIVKRKNAQKKVD